VPSFETAMRSWVSGGKPTFGPSRPHSFILLRALCYADFRPDPRGFGLFSLFKDTPNPESSNCGGDGLAISNPRNIANMVRPRIKEYFLLRVRFGVGVEFPRALLLGDKNLQQ